MSCLAKKFSRMILAMVLVGAIYRGQARADFLVDWFTIAGGGGASTAEGFSLVATLGQAHAGTVVGGDFAVQGGFWGFRLRNQVPELPALRVVSTLSNTLVFAWPSSFTGFVLEESDSLDPSTWAVVEFSPVQLGSEWQVALPMSGVRQFYRLRLQ